ncbi:Tn3 family transposase [Collimonas antrihumi]|uniref:Tn3 family transposase n=1 Tax=Collimonas antrihumi TaxID=1940615 RepID=UPI001B8C97BC|nr:Tn3 family transposase [Collimonas antrihumi]
MASIERTAYPRFPNVLPSRDIQAYYTPSPEEIEWVRSLARGQDTQLSVLVLLKCFEQLHYFPPVADIPPEIVSHIAAVRGFPVANTVVYNSATTLYRHHAAIRKYLGVSPFDGPDARKLAIRVAREAAQVVDMRTDIINAIVEELIGCHYELPAFSTLDKIAEQVHTTVQDQLFKRVAKRLTSEQHDYLENLLATELAQRQTQFNQIKRSAKRASKKHLENLLDHLTWLESLIEVDQPLEGIPLSKLRHFASQAMALDAAELKGLNVEKRHTLILALIRSMRVRARDDLTEMFIRRMAVIHKRAREELASIQLRQRALSERLVEKLDSVLDILVDDLGDQRTGLEIRKLLAPGGNLERLREECEAIRVWSGKNHLPLLWKPFTSHRAIIFRIARVLVFESVTQNRALLDALNVVLENETRRTDWVEDVVDLSFATDRWHKLVKRPHEDGEPTNRRYLELSVFSHLASELRSGDVCVAGSETFADHRQHLLSWEECQKMLPAYCEKIGLPDNAKDFVAVLKKKLADKAEEVDREFPDHHGDVVIGPTGEPVLKRVTAKEIPASAIALQSTIMNRLPTRNLLDVLANLEHWVRFTRHFGPISGSDPKLKRAAERYLLTIFALGCNLGPNQAARHLAGDVTPHMLSFVNRRHMTVENLDAAIRDLNELHLRLDLPKLWGDGKSVAADGTQYDFYEENLLAGFHFRYRKMGAVAYRHVANNYIAVFRHFIAPGVWEAIYVIEGLLKAKLSVEADTVYSHTQGQSAAVFAFTYLLGINLMPRIRNWKDLDLQRADKKTRYKHIDRLFTETTDWGLIESEWQNMMRIALSIQAGRIASPLLLKKLSAHTGRSRLFAAVRELGGAVRTIFLLKWISDIKLRQEVTGETNKMESYNGFAKWLSFGGDVIAQNDPEEQQKRLRYNDLVAAAVILQNTVDMMRVVQTLVAEGHEIDISDLTFLSPYITSGVKRFGDYHLNLKRTPEQWIRDTLFRKAATESRRKGNEGENA